MSEFPLLCIRGDDCHPDGARTTGQVAWFCVSCVQKMRQNLQLIADSWLDLSKALTGGEDAMQYREQEGKQKRGGKTHGLQLNETAVQARAKASEHLRWMMRDLLDTYDEDGRVLLLPQRQTIPAVAQWLATEHVGDFAGHGSDHIALETWDDLAEIRSLIMRGAYPLGIGKLVLGIPCDEHTTSETGERVPCMGTLYMLTSRKSDDYPDILCTEDQAHRVATGAWMAGSWRRRHFRDMDEDAVTRLVRGINSRHTSESA